MAERQRPPPPQQPPSHARSPAMRAAHHAQLQLQLQQHQQQHQPSFYGPGRGPPPPSELPLTLPVLMRLLRDAEYLTARYGSTAAACARLDELEHAHAELLAQVAALQQKLSMAMAQADANVNTNTNGGPATASNSARQLAAAPMLFDVDALLGFLQRHCACRGDLALLQPVLGDFQRSLVLPVDARFPARELLISVQEIVDYSNPQPPPHSHPHQQLQQNHQVFLHTNDTSHNTNTIPPPVIGHSPMPHDARKKRHPDLTRLTPKDKVPGPSSPARSNGSGSGSTAHTPRLIAPASGGGSGSGSGSRGPPPAQPPSSVDRRARQEEKQAASAAAMLSALSRPTNAVGAGGKDTAANTVDRSSTKKPSSTTTTPSTRRSQAETPTPEAAAIAAARQKKRASLRPHDTDHETTETQDKVAVSNHVVAAGSHGDPVAMAPSGDEAVHTRKRSTSMATGSSSTTPAASHEVVVKQNLSLPHDKRNIVELKQSSQLLTLESLDDLNRRAPWDDVYKRRTTFSHVLDFATLDDAARTWFIHALRIQFVWRREFWERLHWLPMSEAVCSGAGWERYRQTRKRRANKAIAAWRKVYSDSLELMRQRRLPEDVWCDVALWYMPSTPLYWLPNSPDLVTELAAVDAKHPVRCYFVKDLRKHPFYNDDDIQRKYPTQHALPTPAMLAVPTDDKEARVNFT